MNVCLINYHSFIHFHPSNSIIV